MQKYFAQAISGNWSYNPLQYDNNEVPLSVMAGDMLMAYKYGWKTSYYQNTYDFKGEEEDVQPSGIDTPITYANGEHLNGETAVNGEHVNGEAKVEEQLQDLEDGECEACTI